ncbi:uncharacterized protein JCM6883_004160 [Sporobolomyces salmoneus]|uniref:uncharacterized protein n=1 Tax=Sporobolomyces salmoneus TaxID=183962 RepID=UPI003176712A
MTSRSDKRRSLPRPTTTTSNANSPLPLPLPLPFPRPLGPSTHRRTQSSAGSLPSPSKRDSTSNKQHSRSKSWLANLFKSPPPPSATISTLTCSSSSSTRTKDLATAAATTTNSKRASKQKSVPVDEVGTREITLTPSLPPPGVYTNPRRPATKEGAEEEEQDLAKRLASWDWDGGERLDIEDIEDSEDEINTTLEIKQRFGDERGEEEEGDQSLGTVWRGFCADTFENSLSSSFVRPHLLSRALSPTATSPPLPPIPHPEETTTTGGGRERQTSEPEEISFLSLTGDSSLAISTTTSHYNLLSTFPSPSGGEISFTDPFSFQNHLSSSTSDSPRAPSISTTRSPRRTSSSGYSTLAERRFKPVPALRLVLPRKPSAAHSTISESVYSRYDDDDDEDEEEEDSRRNGTGLERNYPFAGTAIEQSYFSPISPEHPFSFNALHSSSPLANSPLERSPRSTDSKPKLSARSPLATSTSTSSSSACSSSNPLYNSSSRSSESAGRHSLLFETPTVAPPSSTFDYVERFEPISTTTKGSEQHEDEKRAGRISGWREDWGFKREEQERPETETEEEEEDVSEGELEKRISLYGQREMERRAMERKERWKEERYLLYGEVDAEYEFGLAL